MLTLNQIWTDSNKDAYSQCSYFRMINNSGQIHCSLAMAKSCVAPFKPVKILRLKLTAAFISVKVSDALHSELEYDQVTEVFWTNSKVKHLSPTESNRYVTAQHRVNGSTWKQTRIRQSMPPVVYMYKTYLKTHVGGMAHISFGNCCISRVFLTALSPCTFLQKILK